MRLDSAFAAMVDKHIAEAGDYRAQRRYLAQFVLALCDWAYVHADELKRLEAEEQANARDVQATIADIRRDEMPKRARAKDRRIGVARP